ncbi:hypothetical protein BH23GEM6_BH23GEM6_23320 [soil metagenome]
MVTHVSDQTMRTAPIVGGPLTAERWGLRLTQLGAVALILAVTVEKAFELDRFFVPKELALHLTALAAGLLLAGTFRRAQFTRVDLSLVAYLAVGVLSALVATNGWLAGRALAISFSGVALFWVGRSLREAGLGRPLLRVLALAVVIGAALSLAQAYGIRTDFFSENRAPGGTLGNRNSIAHMAAFGLPWVVLSAVRAWRPGGYLLGAIGIMIVFATLVLTRSRAGWLAAGAVLLVLLIAMLASRPLRNHGRSWVRLAGILLLTAAGVGAALLLPNSLRWTGDNPYLETARGVANYQDGSGQGRLVQYRQTVEMAMSSPLLGVGPGNWAVKYPARAAPGDPSLDRSAPGTTSNPWPSSDWVAFVSERGFPAVVLLGLALLMIAAGGAKRLIQARDEEEGWEAAALLATMAAVLVAGMFDAVLLLALPTLLVWTAIGVLWSPVPDNGLRLSPGARTMLLVLVSLVAGLGAVRSTGQLAAMRIYATADGGHALERAASMDPGNYRLRLRLARSDSRANQEQRCRHALAARGLFPNARAARDLARPCSS